MGIGNDAGRRTVEAAGGVLLTNEYPCAALLTQALDLYKNAKRGKHKHFHAADRLDKWGGVLSVLTTFTSTAAAVLITIKGLMADTVVAGYLPTWLILLVSVVSAGFVTFQNAVTLKLRARAHRDIGNQYIDVSRRTETVVASFIDRIPLKEDPEKRMIALEERIELLMSHYSSVNEQAESYPTDESDIRAAREIEKGGGSQIPIVAQLIGHLAGSKDGVPSAPARADAPDEA